MFDNVCITCIDSDESADDGATLTLSHTPREKEDIHGDDCGRIKVVRDS